MALFGFGKKKEETACCCGGSCTSEAMERAETEKAEQKGIKILGSGCKKCDALEAAVREALRDMGCEEEVEHIRDFAQIASYGVLTTPALVVDGKVVCYGKVLSAKEALSLLQNTRR